MNTKILVCCHKKDICAIQNPYMPIHVGKTLSSVDLKFTGDDTGDNISEKNPSYCELTGIYWAWKNLKNIDVIGLCHYRRYFDFHRQCKWGYPLTEFDTKDIDKMDLSIPASVINDIAQGKILVSKPQTVSTLYIQYAVHHRMEDIIKLREIVNNICDKQSIDAFDKVFYKTNKLRPFNMFIMKWDDFDKYCKWLFDILFDLENEIDISSYGQYQSRIYGFIAERLLNVYVEMKKEKIIEKPIISFTDDKKYHENVRNYIQYIFRCKALDLSNYILSRIKL